MNQTTSVSRYWFPAKRYGWGWSVPTTWQGWAVLAGYVAVLSLLALVAPPPDHTPVFVCGLVILSASLLLICWLKGEPPRWRWGK